MKAFTLLSSERVCVALGVRIKRLRLARNITQQQLAKMTQASLSSVRRLEAQGQANFDFVVRVAQALQVGEQFDGLFTQPAASIAETERSLAQAQRQRARLPVPARRRSN